MLTGTHQQPRTMAKPIAAFSSIKALRTVAANQLEVDPARACAMALQACDQILALCADHDVQIPTERPVVQTALYRYMEISKGGQTSQRIARGEFEQPELEDMAVDLLGVMDVLFEAVLRKLKER